MEYIQDLWESYKESTMPDDATEVQIIEARLAFFSSAAAIFSLITGMTEKEGVTNEEGSKFLSDLDTEIEKFINDVANEDIEFFLT